jgi:flagellar biosynthetic protein FlhB
VFGVFADLMPFFVVFVLAALGGSLLQHGGVFTFETILPKFSKVNPIQGFSRLFSMRSLVELFKSIGKMVIIGFAVYLGLEKSIPEVVGLLDHDIPRIIAFLAETSLGVMWRVALAFTGIALLDFIYQQYEHLKGLRMTKQEIKDELKQMEGDPLLKGRIRQIQREMAQRRMMQEVPKADVVITNPTHVAVALKYTPGKMSAPAVVAKGAGLIAARIREVAREHTVPLVENPPLARTLYREVDLNHTIPPALFKAVAEVLAYVFNLKGRRVR